MYTPHADPLATTMGHAEGRPPVGPPPPIIATRYALGDHLASGGLGEVYRVRDLRLERDVALKLSTRSDARSLTRFQREASLTARLEHPAIIPVHDRGELDDGRAWFTMRLVRGRTLGQVVAAFHAAQGADGWQVTEDGVSLRRLVEVLLRLSEAVAYAHQQGVVHCDIKPANVMVGTFGEVQVMDWGLARAFAAATTSIEYLLEDAPSEGFAGTPNYMAPEQAARLGAYGPVTDLWGLGGLLLEILAGKAPFDHETGPPWPALNGVEPVPTVLERAGPRAECLPGELVELCRAARRFDPAERLADAAVFAEALHAWLDGARRHARALARVRAADARQPDVVALRRKAEQDRRRAVELAAALEPHATVAAWRPIWALEDRAAERRLLAEQAEAVWKQDLRAALNLDPDLDAAHERLADHYVDRIRAAEAERRPAAVARGEALLSVHARARHRPFLEGRGRIEVQVHPPGARVELMRFVEIDRRLVARPTGDCAVGPRCRWDVEHGSYLLLARAEGHHPVRLPLVVERGETWHRLGPGESRPRPLVLPPVDGMDEGDILVPGGWCVVGGDPLAPDAPPRRRIWVEDFVMRRDPVTVREWLGFLADVATRQGFPVADSLAPHTQPADMSNQSSLLHRFPDGTLALTADPAEHDGGRFQNPELPINRVDWRSAMAFAGWVRSRTGRGWRLPDEFEWEKAARGVDGRFRPWGDHALPQWAVVLDSFDAETPGRRPVGANAHDTGPFGVRGLAGNVRTWCVNRWLPGGSTVVADRLVVEPAAMDAPGLRAVRGAAWSTTNAGARAAARYADPPERRFSSIGLRLVRPLTAAEAEAWQG